MLIKKKKKFIFYFILKIITIIIIILSYIVQRIIFCWIQKFTKVRYLLHMHLVFLYSCNLT